MPLKENVNKIDFQLKDVFESVDIKEDSNKIDGNYINFIITESNKVLDIKILKKDLESFNFNWNYKSDPTNNDSFLVERKSNLATFVDDCKDILKNNRFDSEYIKNIK